MREYTIKGHFKLDNTIVFDAADDREAEKLAKKYFWEIIKDHLSDRNNISFDIKSRELTDEEILNDFNKGYILKESAEVKRASKREDKRLAKEAKVAEKEEAKRLVKEAKEKEKLAKKEAKAAEKEAVTKKRGRKPKTK